MEDAIKVDDKWYVSSTSSHTDDRTLALKQGELFALFNRHGDIQRLGIGEQGLYFDGTRYLSHLGLMINDRRPILLHSTIRKDNTILDVDLTNPDIYEAGKLIIPKDTVHLYRGKI
ncbi:MAG: glycogen debranching N-terminal domain-containing protein, partial [Thiohalomonadales bacterium]